jgi:DNA (cytosine-5)-methyltransferase 1
MSAYYNEIEPFLAQWLRRLIAAGLIADGVVDERSIEDVRATDLVGYRQCHFFAGIGGWSFALRLAGWPDDRPVWTGSCPCQPFSIAGRRQGHADRRHLWPDFHRLVAEHKPPVVFGEQVASKDGRGWLAGVRADLEATGYAVGAADLCAAGVAAPHIRQRLYWVADADAQHVAAWCQRQHHRPTAERVARHHVNASRRPANPWADFATIEGRRVRPGLQLLAHGLPARLARLCAFGNAIVPQVAAAFIAAYCDAVIRNAPRHRLMIERSRRAAKRHKTRVCVMCGSGFTTTRTDAGYCSNVCRQAAYRRSAKPRSSGSGAVDGDEQRRVVLALMRAPYP